MGQPGRDPVARSAMRREILGMHLNRLAVRGAGGGSFPGVLKAVNLLRCTQTSSLR